MCYCLSWQPRDQLTRLLGVQSLSMQRWVVILTMYWVLIGRLHSHRSKNSISFLPKSIILIWIKTTNMQTRCLFWLERLTEALKMNIIHFSRRQGRELQRLMKIQLPVLLTLNSSQGGLMGIRVKIMERRHSGMMKMVIPSVLMIGMKKSFCAGTDINIYEVTPLCQWAFVISIDMD